MKKNEFLFLFITVFIDFLSFGLIFPLLPYYLESFGSSSLIIGLVTAIYSLMQFIFSPLWGRLSDKTGRKPIILISLIGTSVSLLLTALSQNIEILFISRMLAGIFTAASLPTTYAYVADFTEEKDRAEKFGVLGAAWGLGFIFGPALGGILSNISIQTPFFVASSIALINFIFSLYFLPSIKKKKEILKTKKEGILNLSIINHLRSEVGIYFILFFLAAFSLSGLEITFPLFSQQKFNFNETNIGFFFTFIGVIVGFTQGIIVGRLVKKFGELWAIIVAHISMIIGYIVIAFAPNIYLLVFAAMILAFGIALNEPSLAALISKKSTETHGVTLGTTWSMDSLARMIGPTIAGFIFGLSFPEIPFLLNSVILFLSLILLYLYTYRKFINIKLIVKNH